MQDLLDFDDIYDWIYPIDLMWDEESEKVPSNSLDIDSYNREIDLAEYMSEIPRTVARLKRRLTIENKDATPAQLKELRRELTHHLFTIADLMLNEQENTDTLVASLKLASLLANKNGDMSRAQRLFDHFDKYVAERLAPLLQPPIDARRRWLKPSQGGFRSEALIMANLERAIDTIYNVTPAYLGAAALHSPDKSSFALNLYNQSILALSLFAKFGTVKEYSNLIMNHIHMCFNPKKFPGAMPILIDSSERFFSFVEARIDIDLGRGPLATESRQKAFTELEDLIQFDAQLACNLFGRYDFANNIFIKLNKHIDSLLDIDRRVGRKFIQQLTQSYMDEKLNPEINQSGVDQVIDCFNQRLRANPAEMTEKPARPRTSGGSSRLYYKPNSVLKELPAPATSGAPTP